MQDGQTLGIPTGPDTSLVLSEIIGTYIDNRLKEEIKEVKGFRYTDDFELYFKNRADAENALNKLYRITSEMELKLNPHKTEIITLPDIIEPEWIPELKLFNFREHEEGEKFDLISYFSKAFDMAKKYPDDAVLKYAIKRIDWTIKEDNWYIFESLLLSIGLIDSITLPLIKYNLIEYQD